jgi:hypothetical protein
MVIRIAEEGKKKLALPVMHDWLRPVNEPQTEGHAPVLMQVECMPNRTGLYNFGLLATVWTLPCFDARQLQVKSQEKSKPRAFSNHIRL